MFERRKIDEHHLPEVVKTKWSPRVLDEGFVPFPKRLLRCLNELFHGEAGLEHLAVVLAIVDFQRPNLTRGPSISFLAFNAGMSAENFKQRASELIEKGLLSRSGSDDAVRFDLRGLLNQIELKTEED